MATADINGQKLRSERDWKLKQRLFENFVKTQGVAASTDLLLQTHGSPLGLVHPKIGLITSSPEIISQVKSTRGAELKEEMKDFLQSDQKKITQLGLLNAALGEDIGITPSEYSDEWMVSPLEFTRLQVQLDSSLERNTFCHGS